MSEPLRIAAAVEGPTDTIVLRAILRAVLRETDFDFQTLQPEGSAAFGSSRPAERAGDGWESYRWSRQSACEGGGSVSGFFGPVARGRHPPGGNRPNIPATTLRS